LLMDRGRSYNSSSKLVMKPNLLLMKFCFLVMAAVWLKRSYCEWRKHAEKKEIKYVSYYFFLSDFFILPVTSQNIYTRINNNFITCFICPWNTVKFFKEIYWESRTKTAQESKERREMK
jgi:hypothetical protein